MQKLCKAYLQCFICISLVSLLFAAPCRAGIPEDIPLASDTSGYAAGAQSEAAETRELWTGALYTSSYRVGVCFSAQGNVRGVLLLRLRTGKVDVYHITGNIKDNAIQARHSSGHTFKGRLVNSGLVEGDIKLKNGMTIHLEGRRTQDALLTEECGPLPE